MLKTLKNVNQLICKILDFFVTIILNFISNLIDNKSKDQFARDVNFKSKIFEKAKYVIVTATINIFKARIFALKCLSLQ